MKYTTAKKYIIGYRKSVAKGGRIVDHSHLKHCLNSFEIGLKRNKLLGKY